MPRSKENVKRKAPSIDSLQNAANAMRNRHISQRNACKEFNVSRATLQRYLKDTDHYKSFENCKVKQVFSKDEEESLSEYLKTASKMHYGLHRNQLRILAYDFAVANEKAVPGSWWTHKRAGKEWFRGYMKRHPDLSLRKPEPTSLARSTGFNKHTVGVFFSNLKEVIERYKFTASDIYNMDESGINTVQNVTKIIAERGDKQVGSATSGERGSNVTLIACINAVGNSVPPMFIFPRVHFKPFMLHGAPVGSIGSANPSGWSTSSKFLEWLQHFIEHIRPSKEHPKLLILDNHDTHISLEAVTLAKECGIILLTIPPHTSHKLQPLDRSVFGPLKTYYNTACDEWLLFHPAEPITIYNIAELVGKAYPLAFTPKNIQSGFRVSGIWPVDQNIFREDEFLCSSVTDRENPEATNIPINEELTEIEDPIEINMPSTSTHGSVFKSPQDIRPFPKAKPRKGRPTRRKVKSRILTDTPEKEEIERNHNEKIWKEQLKKIRQDARKAREKIVKRTLFEESSSNSEAEMTDPNLSSDSEGSLEKFEEVSEQTLDENKISVGKYILVKIIGKKSHHFYVAKIVSTEDGTLQVKFAKRVRLTNKFVHENENIYDIDKKDIVLILPDPLPAGFSKRQQDFLCFGIDFSSYQVE